MPLDPEQLADLVAAAIDAATAPLVARIAALEHEKALTPRDGRDGLRGEKGDPGAVGPQGPQGLAGERGPQGERGEKGEKGDPGERGAEGPQGLKGLDGKDGRDGIDGKDGAPGLNGKDGRDGVGWADMEEVMEDGGRVLVRRYLHDGVVVKEFRHQTAVMIWRGVYKAGDTYQRGDTVTWAGSLWHCNETTTAQPGQTKAWTLVAKKGADGKSGPVGPQGPQGERGPQGPLGPRGY